MAEIPEKTGGLRVYPKAAAAFPNNYQGGIKTMIMEITTGGAVTSGDITLATSFGTMASLGITTLLRVSMIDAAALTAVITANITWTAAGVISVTGLTAAHTYYVIVEAI